MMDPVAIGVAGALAAGFISFASPCVLPLVPAYLSYVAGHSLHGSQARHDVGSRLAAATLSLFFVAGFSTVFITLGASAMALGSVLLAYRQQTNIVGGLIVIAFGLFTLGLVPRVAWLHRDFRFHPRSPGGRPGSAYLLGIAFGFGWTPCIGPVLGAILTLGAMQASVSGGIALLSAYAVGLGIPFVLSALFTREMAARIPRVRAAGKWLQRLAGVIMVLMGVAILTGQLTAFSYWLLERFPALGRIG